MFLLGRGKEREGVKDKGDGHSEFSSIQEIPCALVYKVCILAIKKKKKEKWGGSSASKYFGIPWSGNVLLFLRKKAAPFRRRFSYGNMGQESLESHHCSLITAQGS